MQTRSLPIHASRVKVLQLETACMVTVLA